MHSDADANYDESNVIIYKDCYGIRKYPENYFDIIFDFGANIGIYSLFARMRHPDTKIVAVEPSKLAQKSLYQNVKHFNIIIDTTALGNGKSLYFTPEKDRLGNQPSKYHHFEEISTERGGGNYAVKSKTLAQIFKKHGCQSTDKYSIKIDCEGSEKYLIGDSASEKILRNSSHVGMEIEFKGIEKYVVWRTPLSEPTILWEEWSNWVQTNFSDTHSISYKCSKKRKGNGHYVLDKK